MEQQPAKDEYEHYDKMFISLISAFKWTLGKDYPESEFIQKSIKKNYAEPENEDEAEEIISSSRAQTIDEIYAYAAKHDLPTHYVRDAEDIANEEIN